MADEEEREVRRCVLAAAEAQVERIGLKLKHFDALEAALHREREALAVRGPPALCLALAPEVSWF